MKVISVVASKGGVGKTTIAVSLAVAISWADSEKRVAIVDADPQGSTTFWYNVRGERTPELYSLNGQGLRVLLERLSGAGLDYIIVDTAPGLSAWQRQAVEVADLVIVPCQPCEVDLKAIEATEAIVAATCKPSACVLNRAGFRTRLAGQAVTAIRDSGRLLLPVLHQRVDVGEAMSIGRTVLETKPNGAAARELRQLWSAVLALLAQLPAAAAARGDAA